MKTVLVVSIAALGVLVGLSAQEGPGQPGSETVAKPRPKPGAQPTDSTPAPSNTDGDLPKVPSKLSPKNRADDAGDVNFKAESNIVNVDVAVLDNHNGFIPNIPEKSFRVLEDGVPQTVTKVTTGKAPMTVAMVIEFSNRFQSFWSYGWYQTVTAAYQFVNTLTADDYVAIIAYDLKSEILTDFTNDKGRISEALQRLRIPGFSESNMFDAVTDAADRMSKIEGRKAIVLLSSGIDTFSKLTYDKTRKQLQEAGVPVYPVGLLQLQRTLAEANGSLGGARDITFLQGDNELRTFAKETGGQAFFPRFLTEMPAVFGAIEESLRNQYTLTYSPTSSAKDGKFRKITVQLVNPATNEPLKIIDQKQKPIKYQIVAKAGYKGPLAVE
jgi:Ca-activated chloride channel family protein